MVSLCPAVDLGTTDDEAGTGVRERGGTVGLKEKGSGESKRRHYSIQSKLSTMLKQREMERNKKYIQQKE